MKHIIILLLSVLTISAYGQDKYNYVYFNKLTELDGTDYVLATIENTGKMYTTNSTSLLFINARTGQSKQIDFPKGSFIEKIEQIKIDSFQINRVMITARTVNLNNDKSIDWDDPTQIIMLSTDGQEKVQLTEDNFFVRTWLINRHTGTIVIAGHTDTNNNGKYDKTDKSQVLLYDLKTLKLIVRI
ncbi:hypothetical protein SAMN04488505_102122 [Chitinophaga rupis]|uniref:Uncharacterized protein n=1 Tax=Chitinophaga rupis TaxID=573321 RepID=A0A1H7PN67_9BACT|nr:hypothetical protein [Chitinophaga rupis]SEL36908.1 hypothetical protein SAMN04488505_102122 [Chitinophaga rupis]